MKIKTEHYETMRAAILANSEAPTLLDYRSHGLSEKRWRWDLSYAARLPDGSSLTSFICREVYPYANDEHVDTALRKVLDCPA